MRKWIAFLVTQFGMNGAAQIPNFLPFMILFLVFYGAIRMKFFSHQFEYRSGEFCVEIKEKFVFFLIKRTKIVLEIEKIRTAAVGGVNTAPVQSLPWHRIVNPHIQNGHLVGKVHNRNCQHLYAVGSGNQRPIAIGLLGVVLARFQKNRLPQTAFYVLYGRQVGCGK